MLGLKAAEEEGDSLVEWKDCAIFSRVEGCDLMVVTVPLFWQVVIRRGSSGLGDFRSLQAVCEFYERLGKSGRLRHRGGLAYCWYLLLPLAGDHALPLWA